MTKDLLRLRAHLSKSNNGTSILFTGAGFSFGSKNIKGEMPRDSINLSRQICKIAEIDEDDDLYYSSEYYLDNKPPNKLVDLLKSEYSIKEVSKFHELIARKSWRRVYTTNYDRVFEIASNNVGKVCESVSISSAPSQYSQNNQCVHLNGTIENLTKDALSEEFKLSDSSYVTPETLNNSKWKSTFSVDIEHASAIFFVGYSMYDLDIKRIIKNDIDVKSKTFFIVKPGEDKKEIFKLSKYGSVLDIGIDEFAKLVSEIIADDTSAQSDDLEFFSKFTITERIKEPTDNQIIELFFKGKLLQSEIFTSVTDESNYLIKRIDVDKNAQLVADGKNFLVIGEIACGKTIYIKQLSSIICSQGKDVFFLTNEEGDYKRDVTIINDISPSPIFIIDNAFRHEDVIKDLYAFFGGRATFVLAGRTDFIERTKIALANIDLNFFEEDFDHLCSDEISNLNRICNFIGYWGVKNSWSNNKKERYLSETCEGKFSSILLEFFKSEYVRNELDKFLSDLRNTKNKNRDVIFVIILLGMLPFSPRKSLVSDICGNEQIYSSEFSNNQIVKTLLTFKDGHVEISSGILSKYILNKYFSGREIVDKMIDIIAHFETIKKTSQVNDSVFKELLRFKNVNFMLPDDNRGSNLRTFFNNLKSTLSWLDRSPHFWLQYGMANMFINDFSMAKQYFENAYGTAENTPYYDTKYIDNQMARWHLEFGLTKTKPSDVFDHLQAAYKLLSSQDIDYYFCKQARFFEEYFKGFYQNFTNRNKANFQNMCEKIIARFSKSKGFIERHHGAYTDECEAMFVSILNEIKPPKK
ncbi:SIR2 family protein [Thiovibrio frasassiensis]|uniref:SIR2 family protein n=1 Tax=Thiovibrio frasassiensis TaxID=2984131 RepID=A0A9X4MFX4_9BACT|nr:SIR2 family protein [Thiovibrio frasassiensis]MDG4475902.1 SIR2 family protein [Thiovibrio frasassiensis]